MRIAVAAVLGLLLVINVAGCGGTTIPSPPSDAKPGPPPGTSPEWTKPVKPQGLPGTFPKK